MTNAEETRAALQQASDDLLQGRVAGPLTGIRLAELAGVKRHRLTLDNPDINAAFQRRAREINRTKPEVEALRKKLSEELERNKRLVGERDDLAARLNQYATALLLVTDERDSLLRTLANPSNVIAFSKPR